MPAARSSQPIVLPRLRHEIAGSDDLLRPSVIAPQPANGALFGIMAIDPFEARRKSVALVKRAVAAVECVQILDPFLHPGMPRVICKMPIEAQFVIPFPPLGELIAHKQKLFARLQEHVTEEQP